MVVRSSGTTSLRGSPYTVEVECRQCQRTHEFECVDPDQYDNWDPDYCSMCEDVVIRIMDECDKQDDFNQLRRGHAEISFSFLDIDYLPFWEIERLQKSGLKTDSEGLSISFAGFFHREGETFISICVSDRKRRI